VKMTRLSCHRFRSNEVRLWLSVIAYNLQPVAAAAAAAACGPLVVDEPATTIGQDGRPAGQARPVLLAPVGRKSFDAAAVRSDGAADGGVARASGVGEPSTGSDFRDERGGGRKSVGAISRKKGRFGLGHSQDC